MNRKKITDSKKVGKKAHCWDEMGLTGGAWGLLLHLVSTWSLKRNRHALSTETVLRTHSDWGIGRHYEERFRLTPKSVPYIIYLRGS